MRWPNGLPNDAPCRRGQRTTSVKATTFQRPPNSRRFIHGSRRLALGQEDVPGHNDFTFACGGLQLQHRRLRQRGRGEVGRVSKMGRMPAARFRSYLVVRESHSPRSLAQPYVNRKENPDQQCQPPRGVRRRTARTLRRWEFVGPREESNPNRCAPCRADSQQKRAHVWQQSWRP